MLKESSYFSREGRKRRAIFCRMFTNQMLKIPSANADGKALR